MSYLSEFDNNGIFVLSNANTFNFLDRMQPLGKILNNELFVTIIQSCPTGTDQMDYILDYIADFYLDDPSVGLFGIDDDYVEIITDAIAINNEEIIYQLSNILGIYSFSTPHFIKMVYPCHSVMRIDYL